MEKIHTSPLHEAVYILDGVKNMARECKVSLNAVYKWLRKGYPPLGRCEAIEAAVGGKITRYELLSPSFKSKPITKNDAHSTTPNQSA